MPQPLNFALFYLLNMIVGLYIIVVILRFFLQTFHAPYHHSISQVIRLFTSPLLRPLQSIFPSIKGVDLALIFLLLALEVIKVVVLALFQWHTFGHLGGVMIWAIGGLLNDIANVWFYAIIIGAILSWMPALQTYGLAEIIHVITDPLLSLFQRVIPLVAGLDFSPLVALITIRLVAIVLLDPLVRLGMAIALS